ncbi:MAG: UDP-N-acetylmuramoyl-L-alanine--D-glutamate ligase [Clostridia bacterium]|nr:UDP-N-acetylmuramoyl-L-alanine--D-glutamate ligase [Clostridia bacterium]
MLPQRQTFFVLGLSRSGCAAARFLLRNRATVYVYDDLDEGVVGQNRRALVEMGAKEVKKEDLATMATICDALVLSPGIPIDHPIAVSFRRSGKGVIGETELAARYITAPSVAVTGTNGKTTTVSMINEIINASGRKSYACGNIGTPLISALEQEPPHFVVAEISSFQLETLNSFCPHVAVVLNITQDHLNRHYNMENYLFLKAKLLKNLTETEYAVLNYDDERISGFAEKTKARVVYFSMRAKIDGAYFDGADLCYGEEKILPADEMLIGGGHNIQNALAAICVGKLLGIDNQDIARTLKNFKGARHRLEEVGVVDGVRYVDDSKGTNADATVKAIRCMKSNTVLLLGGKDKGQDYDDVFVEVAKSNVVHTILYGENRFRLINCAEKNDWKNVTLCTGFDCAVQFARLLAKEGETVLLSPASASFDEFTDYEERGKRFVEIVNGFAKEREGREKDEKAEIALIVQDAGADREEG